MDTPFYKDFQKHEDTSQGRVGGTGFMPSSMILSKLEQTEMYEDPDMLDNHFRSVLRDRTPEKPMFESDIRRDNSAQRNAVLTLRQSGGRSNIEPRHPDLFLGFTDRDKRGWVTNPDMRHAVEQSQARMRFIDLTSNATSDMHVPEIHRSEMREILDMRKMIPLAKKRMKIFSTSKDGRTSRRVNILDENKTMKMLDKHLVLNPNKAKTTLHRTNNTQLKSDLIKNGYRSIGSQMFKVSSYGMSHRAMRQDARRAHDMHNTSGKFGDSKIAIAQLAKQIMDVAKRMKHTKYSHKYDDSTIANSTKARLLADVLSMKRLAVAKTSGKSKETKTQKKIQLTDDTLSRDAIVDEEIYKKLIDGKVNVRLSTKHADPNRNITIADVKVRDWGDVKAKKSQAVNNERLETMMDEKKKYKHRNQSTRKQDFKYMMNKQKPGTITAKTHPSARSKTLNRYKKGRGNPRSLAHRMHSTERYNSINDSVPVRFK